MHKREYVWAAEFRNYIRKPSVFFSGNSCFHPDMVKTISRSQCGRNISIFLQVVFKREYQWIPRCFYDTYLLPGDASEVPQHNCFFGKSKYFLVGISEFFHFFWLWRSLAVSSIWSSRWFSVIVSKTNTPTNKIPEWGFHIQTRNGVFR